MDPDPDWGLLLNQETQYQITCYTVAEQRLKSSV
jgi:hypothetical protein